MGDMPEVRREQMRKCRRSFEWWVDRFGTALLRGYHCTLGEFGGLDWVGVGNISEYKGWMCRMSTIHVNLLPMQIQTAGVI